MEMLSIAYGQINIRSMKLQFVDDAERLRCNFFLTADSFDIVW